MLYGFGNLVSLLWKSFENVVKGVCKNRGYHISTIPQLVKV